MRLGEGFLDRFEAWLASHEVPAQFLKVYRDGARKMIVAAGDDAVRPKHVDAVIAREEQAGASPKALANLLKIGGALMDFQRGAPDPAPPPEQRPLPLAARATFDLHTPLVREPGRTKDVYRAWRAFVTDDELVLVDAGTAEVLPVVHGGGLLGGLIQGALGMKGVAEAIRERTALLEGRTVEAALQRPGGHLRLLWSGIPSSKVAKHRWTIDRAVGESLAFEFVDREEERRAKPMLQAALGPKLWIP